jgi:SAM-dependent methyltransferase
MIYSAARRSSTPELMDAEDAPFEEFAACLADIARINRATNAYAPTLHWLDALVARSSRTRGGTPLRILDVGSGYGDALRAIAQWARRRDIAVELIGLDINPWATRAAAAATKQGEPIRYETADLFAYDGEAPDAIISSLFTHHLDDDAVIDFLQWMHARARLGWFVNDLHRHVVPYAFIALATRLARAHRFVRNDAPLSVARAFRRDEWRELIERARLAGIQPRVRWEPLFRYCVAWERESGP